MVYSAIKKDEITTLPSTGRKIEVIILSEVGETWVRSLGREDPLEKEMATHSSILAWRIPWTEELGGLQSTGCKESDTTERLHITSPHLMIIQWT